MRPADRSAGTAASGHSWAADGPPAWAKSMGRPVAPYCRATSEVDLTPWHPGSEHVCRRTNPDDHRARPGQRQRRQTFVADTLPQVGRARHDTPGPAGELKSRWTEGVVREQLGAGRWSVVGFVVSRAPRHRVKGAEVETSRQIRAESGHVAKRHIPDSVVDLGTDSPASQGIASSSVITLAAAPTRQFGVLMTSADRRRPGSPGRVRSAVCSGRRVCRSCAEARSPWPRRG